MSTAQISARRSSQEKSTPKVYCMLHINVCNGNFRAGENKRHPLKHFSYYSDAARGTRGERRRRGVARKRQHHVSVPRTLGVSAFVRACVRTVHVKCVCVCTQRCCCLFVFAHFADVRVPHTRTQTLSEPLFALDSAGALNTSQSKYIYLCSTRTTRSVFRRVRGCFEHTAR